ncbi:MAG: YtxH domain-containing protein [Acidobacteria bacterium]|nr:YtxH domain-containing protein [Acidobacteriota bacterium]
MASEDAGNKVGWFLLGAGLGAILALLFAPKSGRELREEIADTTRRSLDKASEGYQTAKERALELADKGRETASDLIEQTKTGVGKQKDRLSAALDAGKSAYREERERAVASQED